MTCRLFCEEYVKRLPRKPYCTNDLRDGLKIRPLRTALQKFYLQLNPPGYCWVLIFDVDHSMPWDTLNDRELPEFSWVVTNPENGHFHAAYVLKDPVCTSDAGRLAPLRYLAAIEAAYRQLLKADPLYTGLITKNPEITWFWDVCYKDRNGDMAYTLKELASYVLPELRRPRPEKPSSERAGLGRNCYIFETMRKWAYTAIRDYWGSPKDWLGAVEEQCRKVNAEFKTPLDHREVHGIAKSIARWVLRHFSPEGFSEIQRRRIERRWGPSQKQNGLAMLRIGVDPEDVASVAGVHITTVRRWRTEMERQTITASKPWETLGVSRCWYYELLKRGQLEDYERERGIIG